MKSAIRHRQGPPSPLRGEGNALPGRDGGGLTPAYLLFFLMNFISSSMSACASPTTVSAPP